MTPKRIWAKDHNQGHPDDRTWWPNDDIGGTEYHRADLSEALVRAALEWAADVVPDGYYNDSDEWAVWGAAQHLIRTIAANPETVAAIVAQVMKETQ